MRSKVTVVLLFLNVLLFYYIFQYEQKWQAERAQLEARRRVLGPESASIERFSRTSPNAPTISAEKRADGTWWLTQPIEWPANPNAIAGILSELQYLEHDTSWPIGELERSGMSLADYGLATPAMTFTFTAGGKDYALDVGNRVEIGNRLYLLSPGRDRIHVVKEGAADSLALPLEKLRSESVFNIPVFEVRSLAIQTAAPANLKIRLRREAQRWLLEAPILARASKPAVEDAIVALNALQARRFVEARDPDAGRTGLESPQLRLTLEGNSRRETLLLGAALQPATDPAAPVDVYAKFEEKAAVFVTTLTPRLLEDLRRAQEKFRDPRVLDLEPAHVTAITVATPDRPELNLQRVDATSTADSWQLVVRNGSGQAPQTLAADTAIVAELLARLRDLPVLRFVSDAPTAADLETFGFNRPELEITLALSTGGGPRGTDPATIALQIGARPGERSSVYARVGNSPFVYQIEADLLEAIPASPLHYRQRLLRQLPEGTRITALALTDLSTGRELLRKTAAADQALTDDTVAAGEPEARQAALRALLGQLRELRAQTFLPAAFAPTGTELNGANLPWRYRVDLELTLAGGANQTVPAQLFVTARLGGTRQIAGSTDFDGATFEITQALIDALFALTYAPEHDPGPPAPATPAPEPAPRTP